MIGVFSKTTDSNFVEALGLAGMDFIILDQEHGPIHNETLHNHVRAARVSDMKAIVRVKGVDANAIGAALDSGADGVQVPNVETAEQALMAVNAARFYPKGNRGVCRFVKAANFGSTPKSDYFHNANNKMVILQVEGKEGIANLDEILKVEGYDILFIGPYDLSQSLGIPGQIDHPDMKDLMQKVANQVKKKGKKLGTFADSVESAKYLLSLEFEYLAYSVDINIFLEAAIKIRKSLIKKK
ncbi:HpcH/HpaI aldolase family protein [Salinimicrobium sp. HB62]|uniref:HpcH/HpaI aldolase family protein n=1 Tax=Salinimicrobium sp. HB62 TaxID=3077781 RepID=UPI002D78F564|nr:aldolase/citrate lyase family protein [Salinimicrobium sp. HB62]